ncbi:MAG: serine protease [Pirellulaceae bacterium]
MPEKLQAMFASRRFWVALAGVLVVVLQELGMPIAEDHVQMIVLVLASWIVGDSIRSTGGAFAAAVLLACVLSVPAMADDAHDLCRAATVRVRNGSSLGTGTAFRASRDYVYVLTNAHVAGTRLGTRVECEFWREGHQSSPVAGETVVVAYVPRAYRDIAVVRIDRRLLRGYLPAVVPIANPDEQADYRRLFSVGCASGRWPTAFEGFALRRNASGGDTVHFVPAPAGGRSGSALFDVEGDTPRIVGLVAWRSSDNGGHGLDGRGEKHGYGIAMTHHEVWAGLRGERQSISLAAPNDAIPVQHTETDKTKTETGERSVLKQPSPPAAPLETGSSGDVILLYSDPVAIGPNPEPPAVGGCEDGRCLPPQDSPSDPLFPSMPDDLGGSPDTPTPSMPASRDWLPWAIAIAAVIVLVGRPLLRVPGAAVDWFAGRVEQRLQTHAQAPPQPTDKKA